MAPSGVMGNVGHGSVGVGSLLNENGVRSFVAAKDTSREFNNSQDNTDRGSMSDQAFVFSASSMESLPSASGSSKCSSNFLKLTNFYCIY